MSESVAKRALKGYVIVCDAERRPNIPQGLSFYDSPEMREEGTETQRRDGWGKEWRFHKGSDSRGRERSRNCCTLFPGLKVWMSHAFVPVACRHLIVRLYTRGRGQGLGWGRQKDSVVVHKQHPGPEMNRRVAGLTCVSLAAAPGFTALLIIRWITTVTRDNRCPPPVCTSSPGAGPSVFVSPTSLPHPSIHPWHDRPSSLSVYAAAAASQL